MGTTIKNRGEAVFGDATILDALTVNDECAITGDVDILGDFVLGEDGDGSDLILYGAVANYKAWWDQDGDTNGAFYFGADTYGIQVNLYGDVTGCGVFWDPTTDTNGTLTIGGAGGSKGNDVIIYGDTSGSYAKWDQSADDLILNAACLVFTGTSVSTIDLSGGTSTTDIILSNGATLINAADTLTIEEATTKMTAATLFGVESADIRLGVDAGEYMDIAVTNTTGDVAITHTGNSKIVTWTTTGGFDFVGAIALDATTVSGILSVTDSTAASALTTASLKTAGGIGITKGMWIGQGITMPTTVTGTLFDFVLETEWTTGTLINADVAVAGITLTGDIIGLNIDFGTNVTAVTDHDITAFIFNTPALTQTAANTTNYKGFYVESAGALSQTTAAGTLAWKAIDLVLPVVTCNFGGAAVAVKGLDIGTAGAVESILGTASWRGLNIQMPNLTQTGGSALSYGLYITGGTYTSGTEVAIAIDTVNAGITLGTITGTGIDIGACATGINFSSTLATGISFYNATFVPDANRTDIAIEVGSRANELAVNLANDVSQNFDPIQINIDLTASGGAPTSTSTVNGIYQLITHDTVAMTNLRIKGADWTINAAQNFQDAYVYQGELDIVGNVAIGGEAFVGSFYLNAGTGTYAVNDRLAALFAIVSGTATVTGTYNVAQFMASANADVDSVLYLNTNDTASPTQMLALDPQVTTNGIILGTTGSGAYGEAIQIGGTYDHGIKFTEDPVAGDVTNSFINIGDYTTGIAVEPSGANMFGVMHNVTFAEDVAYWYQAYYTKITTSGTTDSSSIAGHAYRMVVASDLNACYGVQSHVALSGARTFTSEVTPGSFYLDVGTGSVSATGNRVNALQAVVTGGATVTGNYCIAEFSAATNAGLDSLLCLRTNSTVSATSGLLMAIDGTVTYAFDFAGTVPDAWTTATAGTSLTPSGEYVLIPVDVAGTTNPLFMVAAQTWTAA